MVSQWTSNWIGSYYPILWSQYTSSWIASYYPIIWSQRTSIWFSSYYPIVCSRYTFNWIGSQYTSNLIKSSYDLPNRDMVTIYFQLNGHIILPIKSSHNILPIELGFILLNTMVTNYFQLNHFVENATQVTDQSWYPIVWSRFTSSWIGGLSYSTVWSQIASNWTTSSIAQPKWHTNHDLHLLM